jgi:hypothetical protein
MTLLGGRWASLERFTWRRLIVFVERGLEDSSFASEVLQSVQD